MDFFERIYYNNSNKNYVICVPFQSLIKNKMAQEKISHMMKSLRANYPKKITDINVERVVDYDKHIIYDNFKDYL